jgi:hypothetical protein
MRRVLALAAVAFVCTALFAGVGAAAHEEPRRTILGVELGGDGDAVVYYIQTHNLNKTEQRERYESFVGNETKQQAHRDEIVSELEAAAAGGRNRTELDMRVHNGSVRTYEQDGFGRLEVRVDWDNLAFAGEDRVVVTEPFRGGYEPDLSRVGIHGPEGYRRGTMQPPPLRVQRNSGLWNPRTSNFSQFYAEFTNPDAGGGGGETQDGGGDGDGGDGDGDSGVRDFLRALLIALVPVALVLAALHRRE